MFTVRYLLHLQTLQGPDHPNCRLSAPDMRLVPSPPRHQDPQTTSLEKNVRNRTIQMSAFAVDNLDTWLDYCCRSVLNTVLKFNFKDSYETKWQLSNTCSVTQLKHGGYKSLRGGPRKQPGTQNPVGSLLSNITNITTVIILEIAINFYTISIQRV